MSVRWKFLMLYLSLSIALLRADVATPDLALQNVHGETERLADFRGRIVVLNFWATWCKPCQKELPILVASHASYAQRGVEFIAASLDDSETRKDVPDFVQRYRIPFRVWVGATPEQQAKLHLAKALPATAIVDRDGTVAFRIIGEARSEVLTERLEWLLSQREGLRPSELVLPPGITPEHFREHELGLEDKHEEAESEVPS
jgi:peroxiredoxin